MTTTSTTHVVEIDQAAITAPQFPRDANWWRNFLPLWFMEPRWWETPKPSWDKSGVTVDDQTGMVAIKAENRRHANRIAAWLLGSVLAQRYMTDPDTHIRLVASTATSTPDRR